MRRNISIGPVTGDAATRAPPKDPSALSATGVRTGSSLLRPSVPQERQKAFWFVGLSARRGDQERWTAIPNSSAQPLITR
jgi:hypothetical protein